MKRSVVVFLTGLALLSGLADAGRRSGGGFGGSSRSSSSSSSRSSGSSYRSSPSRNSGSSYRSSPSRSSGSSYRSSPSRNSNYGRSSSYNGSSYSRSGNSTPSKTTYPSNAAVRSNPLNTAAAARVTPTQLNQWRKLQLPPGVSRNALTYSAAPSAGYQYQLQPGRYYPYPQSYYRQHNIGYDLLKYALIFTAVSSVADAMTPNVAANSGYGSSYGNGNYPSYTPNTVAVQQRGPGLGAYLGVGLLAAAAAWLLMGRRRR